MDWFSPRDYSCIIMRIILIINQHRKKMRSKHVSLPLTAAIVLIVRSMAWADSAEPVSGQSTDLSPIVVTASADASAAGVQPPYAGGQVARGGRVGIFGSQDIMDTPFSITNYTHE